MIWVGVTKETGETVEKAPLSGSLCKDWACAMPPAPGSGYGPATTLYRTSSSDVASAMAQRLAKRVGKPVFLSVDVVEEMWMAAEKGITTLLDRP
jgi:proteasome assembly chaperone 4